MLPRFRTLAAFASLLTLAACSMTRPTEGRQGPATIEVSPPTLNIVSGEHQMLYARGFRADLREVALTNVVWSVQDESVAKIADSENALADLVGLKSGSTLVTVTAGRTVASVPVVVTPKAQTLRIDPDSCLVSLNGTFKLTAYATVDGITGDLDVSSDASWEIGDPAVAAVSGGTVTGLTVGTTLVTAKYGGKDAQATCAVTDKVATGLTIEPRTIRLAIGTAASAKAVLVFSDSSTVEITDQATWTVSNPALVQLDTGRRGRMLGLSAGATTVTATYQSFADAAQVNVTAAELRDLQVTPATLQIANGTSGTLRAVAIYSDGSNYDVTDLATWTSDAAAVTVDSASPGTVHGAQPGTANVTASFKTLTRTASVTVTTATLTGIVVTPVGPSVALGTSLRLTATGTFSDLTTQDLTTVAIWSSSALATATVGSDGLVVGRGLGSATITAAVGATTGSTTVTVTPATVASITVEPATGSVAKGTTLKLKATAVFSDGTRRDVTDVASWTSSSTANASVTTTGTGRGLVTGVLEGAATIKASFGGQDGTAQITVTAAIVTRIDILPSPAVLPKGGQLQLHASGTFSDGSKQDVTDLVTWAVVDAVTAAVSNVAGSRGQVTGLAVGQTTITATIGDVVGSVTLTVNPAELVRIDIVPTTLTLEAHQTRPLAAKATYSDGSILLVTDQTSWTSADPGIAAVVSVGTGRGIVTGNTPGQTTITAAFNGKTATVSITVTAPRIVRLVITPDTLSLNLNATGQLKAIATYSDNTQQEVTAQATWTTSDATVATVDLGASGATVSAKLPGAATITASLGGQTATCAVTVKNATLQALKISPASASIAVAATQTFTVSAVYSDGTTVDVTAAATYTSADTSIVTMAQNVATGAHAGGPIAITASYNGFSAVAQLTVTGSTGTLVAITISPNGLNLKKGASSQLKALGKYSDGTEVDITAQVAWASNDLTIAGVDAAGAVTAIGVGATQITAKAQGITATIPVTVTAPQLVRLAVNPYRAVLRPDLIYSNYKVYAIYDNNTVTDITAAVTSNWTSTNPSIVDTYLQGTIWGPICAGVGQAELHVSYQGLIGKAPIQCVNQNSNGGEIAPARVKIPVGVSVKLAGAVTYADGFVTEISNPNMTSSNTTVAEVDANSWVIGRAVGTATMTASNILGTPSATVQVTNATLTSLTIDVPSRLVVGVTGPIRAVGTFSDGSSMELGMGATWSTSNANVASIEIDPTTADRNFRVAARSSGTVTITASFGTQSTSATLTVVNATLSTLSMTIAQTTLPFGATSPVTVTATYSDGTQLDVSDSVEFVSLQPEIAVANYGLYGNAHSPQVLAEWPGDTTVTGPARIGAKFGGMTDWKDVTVTGDTLSSIALALNTSAPSTSITLSSTGPNKLRAIGTFNGGATGEVTIMCRFQPAKVTSTTVATISNFFPGEVTTIRSGSETVTVEYPQLFIGQPHITSSSTTLTAP